ncbi:PhzF family phenazine biosynthesis protein [Tatumella ptyseos]|uniref:PhzF family phenazine biosynthesis protein n=1 Tax=Tatumella ptyseos TaxID=82987 RepID=UPI0026F0C512|nr:PhzF family phenazine biosynthesis protein [Tatumella ptyseos]WKX25423.1 PhzF family phenazine biosynthesis protein [Tatumella ptyseos]
MQALAVNFKQVDVFTSTPFKGNPVAVILDARGLSTAQMQAIANWTNLSETTFVLPAENSEADYRVRIFTPKSELPFAGHPTIGTAWALLEAGRVVPHEGHLIQECGAGLVRLTLTLGHNGETSIAFDLPKPHITELSPEQIDAIEEMIGCKISRSLCPALVDVGAKWIVAQLSDASSVLNVTPDYARLRQHDLAMAITGICLYGDYPQQEEMTIEVRSFAPACGVNEDPVCGSGNGSVAAFIRYHGKELSMPLQVKASQGQALGREGKVSLIIDHDIIKVGGCAVTCIDGQINL